MRRSVAATAAVVVLALAACGGGGDDLDPEAEQDRNDAAIDAFADAAEDEGFTEEDDDGNDSNELEFDSEECERFADAFDDAEDIAIANAESARFVAGEFETDGGQTTLEAETATVDDEGAAADVFALLDDEDLGDCVVEAFEASFAENADESGLEVGDIDFEELDDPSVGEEAKALQVEGEFLVQGLTIPFRSAIFFARDGGRTVELTLTDVGDTPPGADAEDLLEVMLDELIAE